MTENKNKSENPVSVLLNTLQRSGQSLTETDQDTFARAAAFCDELISDDCEHSATENKKESGKMKDYTLAQITYDAYCRFTGGKSLISGDKLPAFDDLRIDIRDAWYEAAKAAWEHLVQGHS